MSNISDMSIPELLNLKSKLNADLALEEIFDGRKKEMDRMRNEIELITKELDKRTNA